MAINFFEKKYNKIDSKYTSDHSRDSNISKHLLKLSLPGDNVSSSDAKGNKIKKNVNAKSPYLVGDNVHLLSKVTEKKLVHKKTAKIISSFPLAANIYRASSDEFKSQRRGMKKVKKSVLTLPNVPVIIPQTCTVSDMNDSEYFNISDDNKKASAKKRFVAQKRKAKVRNKDYEFYDRDARYCSQMNINLDCSSTDVVNQFNGDGKSKSNNFYSLKKPRSEKEFSAHDMWSVLRNINRFQFRPSPPISNDSIKSPMKIKPRNKRRNNRNERRVVETCRTEEFAYISRFEIDDKSRPSISQSSSFDRITVINKQDDSNETCREFERRVIKTKNIKLKNRRHITNRNSNKNAPRVTAKATEETNNAVLAPPSKNNFDVSKMKDDKTNFFLKEKFNCNQNAIRGNNQLGIIGSQYNEKGLLRNPYEDAEGINENMTKPKDIPTRLRLQSVEINYGKKDIPEKVSSVESAQQIKGITKVILSKGQDLNESRYNDIQKRKPRLSTAIQNCGIMPKLTHTDIKRRLANMKFPMTILGKDQLGSTSIHVTNCEPPQFSGMEKQIWPFMRDWYDQTFPIRENKTGNIIRTDNRLQAYSMSNYKQTNLPINHKHEIIDRNLHESVMNKKKYHKKPLESCEMIKITTQQSRKLNPVHQLKDKMINFLCKNNSVRSMDKQYNTNTNIGTKHSSFITETKPQKIVTKINASTETTRRNHVPIDLSKNNLNEQILDPTKLSVLNRYPWAKKKWTSDFIENVIRKICNGMYYNREQDVRTIKLNSKEVEMQTILTGENIKVTDNTWIGRTIEDCDVIDCLKLTPYKAAETMDKLFGFDASPLALEVRSLSMKELSIKHCTMNVMLKFDVTTPLESEYRTQMIKSSPFIPLSITESDTKILQCKTTLINAMLPAEICCILPTILKSIVDLNTPSMTPYQNDSNLYTISKLSNNEGPNIYKCTLPSVMGCSSTLKKLLDGLYSETSQFRKKKKNKELQFHYSRNYIGDVLHSLLSVDKPITIVHTDFIFSNPILKIQTQLSSMNFNCTALELYKVPKLNTVVEDAHTNINFATCDFNQIIELMWNQKLNIRFKISMPIDNSFENNDITLNIGMKNIETKGKTSVNLNYFKFYSLYNRYVNNSSLDNFSCQAIEYLSTREKAKIKEVNNFSTKTKTKKKRFEKLYKKCKSTTNILRERSSTNLSKITNIDEFFEALGSGKAMSSIFDEHIWNKILSAILEMKNWITEISQRQAMLILLLSNKKDTRNIIRFRSIILQGIAVNRITKASELEMEIEVIEREHFNDFITYDGISYLPETFQSQNNLMEELYWIAKTTASDYQKPFDETSEKLLKSLFEKRKKLNPSYLRVMARYVGLGLLKRSGKNNF